MNNRTTILGFAAILAAVIICSCVVYGKLTDNIVNLSNQLSNANNRILILENSINQSMNQIEENIRTELAKQASILTGYSVTCTDPNADTLTGDITISVIPKEHSASTAATVYIGDKTLQATRNGSAFEVTFASPLGLIYSSFSVSFDNDGVISSEVIKETISFELLPYTKIDANYTGSSSFRDNTITFNGRVDAYFSSTEDKVKTVKMIAVDDNENIVWESSDWSYAGNGNVFSKDVNKSIPLNGSKNIYLYVVFMDEAGFSYRTFVTGAGSENNGQIEVIATDEWQVFGRDGTRIEFTYYN